MSDIFHPCEPRDSLAQLPTMGRPDPWLVKVIAEQCDADRYRAVRVSRRNSLRYLTTRPIDGLTPQEVA